MHEVFSDAIDRLSNGEKVVVATVVRTKGSTPQKPGAKLIVREDGSGAGTLGGGCVEGDIWFAAKQLMQDGGSIMTMTFQASERVFPGYNVMGTAKAALEHEVRQLAFELGPENIRVNALSAGPLDTLSSRVISGYTDMKTAHREKSPLQRNITHEEVAKTALYLASDLSSGVTGEILHVDTGYHIIGF